MKSDRISHNYETFNILKEGGYFWSRRAKNFETVGPYQSFLEDKGTFQKLLSGFFPFRGGGILPLSAKGFLAKGFSVKGVGGRGTPLTEKIR